MGRSWIRIHLFWFKIITHEGNTVRELHHIILADFFIKGKVDIYTH